MTLHVQTIEVPPDAIHWSGAEFGSHGGSGLGADQLDLVTCHWCLLILEGRGPHGVTRRQHERAHRRATLRIAEADRVAAADERRLRQLREIHEVGLASARARRAEEEDRELDQDRRLHERPETPQSYNRATWLGELERALDGWPEYDPDQVLEAALELRADQEQDPDHWRDLRAYWRRGPLRALRWSDLR